LLENNRSTKLSKDNSQFQRSPSKGKLIDRVKSIPAMLRNNSHLDLLDEDDIDQN
jgi:hypothetical protein